MAAALSSCCRRSDNFVKPKKRRVSTLSVRLVGVVFMVKGGVGEDGDADDD